MGTIRCRRVLQEIVSRLQLDTINRTQLEATTITSAALVTSRQPELLLAPTAPLLRRLERRTVCFLLASRHVNHRLHLLPNPLLDPRVIPLRSRHRGQVMTHLPSQHRTLLLILLDNQVVIQPANQLRFLRPIQAVSRPQNRVASLQPTPRRGLAARQQRTLQGNLAAGLVAHRLRFLPLSRVVVPRIFRLQNRVVSPPARLLVNQAANRHQFLAGNQQDFPPASRAAILPRNPPDRLLLSLPEFHRVGLVDSQLASPVQFLLANLAINQQQFRRRNQAGSQHLVPLRGLR
jgi:hypothetical protein